MSYKEISLGELYHNSMVWCSNCVRSSSNPSVMDGVICCTFCGRVLDEVNFSTELTFVKDNDDQEQAAKEAAEQSAYEAYLRNHPDDVRARELVAAANARVAQTRKEKQQKRAAELKNAAPLKTAAEATKQMLSRKRLSSKINYDVLEKLFEDDPVENPNKIQKKIDINSGVGEDGYDELASDYYHDAEY